MYCVPLARRCCWSSSAGSYETLPFRQHAVAGFPILYPETFFDTMGFASSRIRASREGKNGKTMPSSESNAEQPGNP